MGLGASAGLVFGILIKEGSNLKKRLDASFNDKSDEFREMFFEYKDNLIIYTGGMADEDCCRHYIVGIENISKTAYLFGPARILSTELRETLSNVKLLISFLDKYDIEKEHSKEDIGWWLFAEVYP